LPENRIRSSPATAAAANFGAAASPVSRQYNGFLPA